MERKMISTQGAWPPSPPSVLHSNVTSSKKRSLNVLASASGTHQPSNFVPLTCFISFMAILLIIKNYLYYLFLKPHVIYKDLSKPPRYNR